MKKVDFSKSTKDFWQIKVKELNLVYVEYSYYDAELNVVPEFPDTPYVSP